MRSLDIETMDVFWQHCDWAHQCWQFRKYMFDENPDIDLLRYPHHSYFFDRLYKILQEYWLLEVAKLLDPAKQGANNLSINFVYEAGNWSAETRDCLNNLRVRMMDFGAFIKPARNKILSHKDLKTILTRKNLGEFEEGLDIGFFNDLKDFANLASTDLGGELLVYDDLTKNDIEGFMGTFSKGLKS